MELMGAVPFGISSSPSTSSSQHDPQKAILFIPALQLVSGVWAMALWWEDHAVVSLSMWCSQLYVWGFALDNQESLTYKEAVNSSTMAVARAVSGCKQ